MCWGIPGPFSASFIAAPGNSWHLMCDIMRVMLVTQKVKLAAEHAPTTVLHLPGPTTTNGTQATIWYSHNIPGCFVYWYGRSGTRAPMPITWYGFSPMQVTMNTSSSITPLVVIWPLKLFLENAAASFHPGPNDYLQIDFHRGLMRLYGCRPV